MSFWLGMPTYYKTLVEVLKKGYKMYGRCYVGTNIVYDSNSMSLIAFYIGKILLVPMTTRK